MEKNKEIKKIMFKFTDFPDKSRPLSSESLNIIISKLNECIEEINKLKKKN